MHVRERPLRWHGLGTRPADDGRRPGPEPDGTVPGTVAAYTSPELTGKPVAHASADEGGNFVLTAPVGTYYLAGTSPEFDLDPSPVTPPCHADHAIVITENTTSHADVHSTGPGQRGNGRAPRRWPCRSPPDRYESARARRLALRQASL
jgi:hypothetical protein